MAKSRSTANISSLLGSTGGGTSGGGGLADGGDGLVTGGGGLADGGDGLVTGGAGLADGRPFGSAMSAFNRGVWGVYARGVNATEPPRTAAAVSG
jgi:hypothetical protein